MLIETDVAKIASFVARKAEQGQRAMAALPGVHMISSGERGSQIMISAEVDGAYEGVVIGQLPHQQFEATGSSKNPVRRPMPDGKKPHDKRDIDLTDDQVDAIVDRWRSGRSALSLPFVTHVYGADGNLKLR